MSPTPIHSGGQYFIEWGRRFGDTENCPSSGGNNDRCYALTLASSSPFVTNGCWVGSDAEFGAPANVSAEGWGLAPWIGVNPGDCPGNNQQATGWRSSPDITFNITLITEGALVTAGSYPSGSTEAWYSVCDAVATGNVYGLPSSANGAQCNADWGVPPTPEQVVPPANASEVFTNPVHLSLEGGPQNAQPLAYTQNFYIYIYHITLWTCANYQTAPCLTNPVITVQQ